MARLTGLQTPLSLQIGHLIYGWFFHGIGITDQAAAGQNQRAEGCDTMAKEVLLHILIILTS
jgi:hypothetical protein